MEKITVSELEEMIKNKFLEKGASVDDIKEEVVKSITEKIKNKSKNDNSLNKKEDSQVVDVNISKPQDKEGELPESITSSVQISKEMEEILRKEEELKLKEELLSKKEEELNNKEISLKEKEEENKYEPEIPEILNDIEPKKLFIFDKNQISVGAEKLSNIDLNVIDNNDEKVSMKEIWLRDGVKSAELYIVKFEKIGNIEFDPFEGISEFIQEENLNNNNTVPEENSNQENKNIEDFEDVKLDSQGNMKDSIEPLKNVIQPLEKLNDNELEEYNTSEEGEEENFDSKDNFEEKLSARIKDIVKELLNNTNIND